MKHCSIITSAIAAAALLVGGCNSSPAPKQASDQATLNSEARASLTAFENEDPTLHVLLEKSVGYAVFPDVGKAGFAVGGSYGKGEVYENGIRVGYSDITQATFGLQIGAQTFGELVIFLRADDLKKFKANDFTLTANMSAVAIKSGAAATTDTSKGVVVFVRAKGGAMAEASIGGQRFRFQPLQPTTQPAGDAVK